MPPMTPEECDARFCELLNAGEIDDLVELYEEDASHIADDGKIARGRADIHPVMERFSAMGMRLEIGVTQVVHAGGDLALIYDAWKLTPAQALVDKPEAAGTGAHLVRRQEDGSWRYVLTGLTNLPAPVVG